MKEYIYKNSIVRVHGNPNIEELKKSTTCFLKKSERRRNERDEQKEKSA